MTRPRIAYACEGYADIRMLGTLSEIGDLLLLIPEKDYRGGLDQRISEAGLSLRVATLPSRRWLAVPALFAALWKRRHTFDAAISLDIRGGALAASLACSLSDRPHLVQVLTDPVPYWRCRPFRSPLGWMARELGASVLTILVRTNASLATGLFGMGSHYATLLGPHAAKYREVNLYGVDPRWHRPVDPGERPRLREELGLPRDPPLLFYSSRIAPEKDTPTLLKACRRLSEEGRAFTLLNLSGQHERFLEMARVEGLDRHALARPPAHPLRELPRYYQASDLCVQASLAEGFGWSPREALACRTPVIVADVGGMRGDFDGMGLDYPPGDAQALAARLREALSDPGRMQALAERGRAYVLKRYGREKALGDLKRLIEETRRGC